MDTVIWIEPDAPAKPPVGAPCNGCGVCCSLEPCPVGRVFSLRTVGACAALRWHAARGRYVCGALAATEAARGPVAWLHGWLRRLIAAGDGCDCSVDVAAQAVR